MRRFLPNSFLSVFVALALLFATFVVHRLVVNSQTDQIKLVTSTFVSGFSAKLEAHVLVRLGVVELIRKDWERGRISDLDDFREEASSVHFLFDDLQALNWVNPDGVIEVVTPVEGNEPAAGLNVRRLAAPGKTLAEAERTGAMRVTPPISLAQGGSGFVAYLPVIQNARLVGFLNIVFRAEPLITGALGRDAGVSFQVEVTDEDAIMFGQELPLAESEYSVESNIIIGGRNWRIRASPTPAQIAEGQNIVDEIVLLSGIFVAVATSILSNFAASQKISLKHSEERFALAMQGANDGLWDWDPNTGETYFSPRWYEMLGYAPDELPSTYDTFVSLLHPDDERSTTAHPQETIANNGDALESEFRLRHKDGSWVNVLSRAFIVRTHGKVKRIVGTHVDITQLKKQQNELIRAAITDDLTGLRNRRGLSKLLEGISRELLPDERLAILHMDLDKFKSINDTLGHDAGDHVLKSTAKNLVSNIGPSDVAARVGGDEFLIAKKMTGDDESVVALSADLIKKISEPVPFRDKHCHVSASVGVAYIGPQSTVSVEQVIADADIALNSAKSSGRAQCRVFSEDMRATAVQSAILSSQLREGVSKGEFLPYFQPQVDIQTMRIVGFEALARWQHPSRGILSASEFVSVAQEARLIEEIDNQIFQEVCTVVAKLVAKGIADPRVSVNVSTAQLSDPTLVDRLVWAADAAEINPVCIGIEVLESTMLDDRAANVIENIHRLANMGFSIELDDFGTGHAAIANLRKFPVRRIKIDRSLISGIDQDNELVLITSAIVDLARKLGKRVLAEGIETKEELSCLQSTRCTCAQGYLFGHPMPYDELVGWIENWQPGFASGEYEISVA